MDSDLCPIPLQSLQVFRLLKQGIYIYSYKLSLSELIKIMQARNRASINAKQTFFGSEINV